MAQQQLVRTATPLLLVVLLLVSGSVLASPATTTTLAAGVVMRRGGRTCRGGTVGECMEYFGEDAEAEGDLAAAGGGGTRRVLQQGGGSGYIGYNALRRDSVPCSQRGASYYNCRPGGEANPYTRGCSAITQCRG